MPRLWPSRVKSTTFSHLDIGLPLLVSTHGDGTVAPAPLDGEAGQDGRPWRSIPALDLFQVGAGHVKRFADGGVAVPRNALGQEPLDFFDGVDAAGHADSGATLAMWRR